MTVVLVVVADPGDFFTVVVLLVIGVGVDEGFLAVVEAAVVVAGFLAAVVPKPSLGACEIDAKVNKNFLTCKQNISTHRFGCSCTCGGAR